MKRTDKVQFDITENEVKQAVIEYIVKNAPATNPECEIMLNGKPYVEIEVDGSACVIIDVKTKTTKEGSDE